MCPYNVCITRSGNRKGGPGTPVIFPKPLEVCPEIHVDLSMKPTFSKKKHKSIFQKIFLPPIFSKKDKGGSLVGKTE